MATKQKCPKLEEVRASKSQIKRGEVRWDKFPKMSRAQRERVEHIDSTLRRARSRGRASLPSAETFAKELKTSVNTIYATIQSMQNELCLPVQYIRDRHGYCYTEKVVASPFCRLSEAEVLAVYLSHEMIAGFDRMPLKKQAQSAFRKLIDLSGEELSFDASMVEDAFSITPSAHPAYYHPKHFELCCRALLGREELDLTYTSMHGANPGVPEKRRVQPLHLTFHEFAWYLLSWDPAKKDHRLFMLARMNALKGTGVKFTRPEKFNARKILRENFDIFTNGKPVPVPVTLRFAKRAEPLVLVREWHRSQKFSRHPDGSLRMDMKVAITPYLVAWIASYLDDCRIVGPDSLREDVGRRQIRAGMENLGRIAAGEILELVTR